VTGKPIVTAPLFEELDARLLSLLESLSLDDWSRPTVVPKWNVHQVAAHLLDTALRRLSFARDGFAAPDSQLRDGDLVALVNELNARGVGVYGRLSPRVLISLMEPTVRQLSEYLSSLDPFAPARFPVSWAGETVSENWFDIAREFTERWHHQQQIRLAVDRPGIMIPRLYAPVLECFMRGLPHAYRNILAPSGAVAQVSVSGDCGGTWYLRRHHDGWKLVTSADEASIVSTTTIPQQIAWRVFTKGISAAETRALATMTGDERIRSGVLGLVAIVG
jgi:uncharacterized protein (TIGR03083 family)